MRRHRTEFDDHLLRFVVLVPVLDGVDDTFPDGNADPMQRLVVETGQAADMIADHLNEIEHVERAAELNADGMRMRH